MSYTPTRQHPYPRQAPRGTDGCRETLRDHALMPIEPTMEPRSLSPRRVAAPSRWLVLAASLVLLAGVLSPPASGQDPAGRESTPTPSEQERADRIVTDTLALAPKNVPASPDDRFAAVIDARRVSADMALALLVAADLSSQANLKAFQAAQVVGKMRKLADAATKARDASRVRLADERTRLSDLTIRAYVTSGNVDGDHLAAMVNGDTTDPATGRKVIFEQVLMRQEAVTDQARRALARDRKALVVARERLSRAKKASALHTATARRRTQERAAAASAHEQAVRDLDAAVARLRSGRGNGLVPQGVAIIGLPRLTAEDLAGWFAASSYSPRVSTPMADYARWFIQEGTSEGIRGDIAFAQAVLETGGFANTDSVVANNFSGIGHCDLCPSGWRFPSPRLGVRAQIQLLKSYAIRSPDYLFPLVDRRLRGPAGCCKTWGDLTTVWATDPGYGPKVMLIYTSMVQYALGRRSAGQGFDDAPIELPSQ